MISGRWLRGRGETFVSNDPATGDVIWRGSAASAQDVESAVEELGLSQKEADRCRNFFAMGLSFWLYDRPLEPTLRYIESKFSKKPEIAEANRRALKFGYNYGETTEAFGGKYHVAKAALPKGRYRNIMGNEALAYGLITAARQSGCELFLASYPITPLNSGVINSPLHRWLGRPSGSMTKASRLTPRLSKIVVQTSAGVHARVTGYAAMASLCPTT